MKGRTLLRAAVVLGTLVLAPAALAAGGFSAGSDGLGDPMFPLAGNGGYNVSNYSLTLDYTPSGNRLVGTAVINARATQNLSSFDLDFRMHDVTRLLVNGAPAAFSYAKQQELVVTPAAGLVQGKTFTVTVEYAGTPLVVTDPDQSIEGWVPTDDGAFVVNEPQGSPGWYPVNDNPRDKATYDFRVTVPDGLTVMANGVLASETHSAGKATWVWRESDPMAPYLATTTLGKFDLTKSTTSGIPTYVAVDPQLAKGQVLSKLAEAVNFYSSIYGPYPFNAVGAIVDSAKVVGYSLETQTKPNFPYVPDEATLVHELSHMWFGDAVTLTRWPDIWLHEGFATFSEWIWRERHGGQSAQRTFEQLYASKQSPWSPAPAALERPSQLFSTPVYDRGGMTLQALRVKIGDAAFFKLLRDWYLQNRYGNATTEGFIALAEAETGRDLDAFFKAWLYTPAKPTSW